MTGSSNEVVTRLDRVLREEKEELKRNMDQLREEQYARDREEAERTRKEEVTAERKRRKEEERRREDANRIRAEQEEERVREFTIEQRRLMVAEDKCSNALRQQYVVEERAKKGGKMAKKYVKELDRRREEVKVEEQMEKESLERGVLRDKRYFSSFWTILFLYF